VDEYEIFRSKHNATHYVAVLAGDSSDNANGVRESQNLARLTRLLTMGVCTSASTRLQPRRQSQSAASMPSPSLSSRATVSTR